MPGAAMQPGRTPPPPDGGMGYEVINDYQLFDTVAITTAVQAVPNLFVTVQADPTLGNIPSQGQLPDGWFFDVDRVFVDFLTIPALVVATVVGPATDLANIQDTCRATFEFKYNDKSYGVRTLRSLPPSGGVQAFSSGTYVATNGREYAWTGPMGARAPYLNGLRIQPKTKFLGVVSLAVAPTLNQTPLNVCVSLMGRLYRKVT